jgi:tetratricopeptide (TPR) repeat protein
MSLMMDPKELWDFDDPAGSERRFRKAAATTSGDDRAAHLTQVARALGLQERYDEGHAVLDQLAVDDPEVLTRTALERGRLLRSSGDPEAARPHFEAAAASAREAGFEELHLDALHMAALVAPAGDRQRLTEEALAVARASSDPAARDWDASLLNNLGMVHADAGEWPAALDAFEQALAARERQTRAGADPGRTRVAKWMVGWALRNLGRTDEALAVQTALKAELESVGEEDPYVDEELALLSG